MTTTTEITALCTAVSNATTHRAGIEARTALQSAIEALVRDAARINFLRWNKEITI
jgi:hypothetical protein